MKRVSELAKQLWNDESGQGATEYILLLVIVVGLAMMFKQQIMGIVSAKLSELSGNIQSFTATGQ